MKIININDITPIEKRGKYFIKRDDLFSIAGVCGGKVRTCWHLSQNSEGLVTAGSRFSPQVNIVAHIAHKLNITCHIHTPTGKLSLEVQNAVNIGAKLFQHKAGYNSVIIKRAKDDAKIHKFTYIPFGMDCWEAVNQSKNQVKNIPKMAKRIVISVGSGMTLSGILTGLQEHNINIPVLGICVGADPKKRLNKYAPINWKMGLMNVKLVQSKYKYYEYYPDLYFEGIKIDPIYEAKCIPFLEENDLFWVTGIRKTA